MSEILWVDAQGVSGYAGVVDRPRSREQSFSVVVPPTATALRIALGGATAVEVPLSRTRSGGFEPVRVEP